MQDEFISEPIDPEPGSFDAAGMARGEPGLPARFSWRGREFRVSEILRTWKTSAREGGVGELYLRRHWWRIRTVCGEEMTLYAQRQARGRRRWYLYTLAR